ncbi:hypothetical protein CLV24_10920 [Pontibacter ummariensis]|uniref:Uncharacterized protein n=1 Tax=Pontibacter ummariensis TaxID=1610492 RepID=A0A239FY67_9BACT|nr:ABC-three component system middle component 1 [Pontibacter ummariensis]PRY11895.1 hypothetical protein CLV24_10920 [Pontibacter ummariensis]SNS61133.1 hypothetical protein SAMN06296052_109150 [Pontibacter ummariensis]
MLSSHDHNITKFFSERYPNEFITFKLIEYKGNVSVFVFYFEEESELEKTWSNVSGNVAGLYQAELAEDFDMWNIYMFYLCRSELSLALKYKIENDRFSSRKIVLDNYEEEISDIGINDIIDEHITNIDIMYDPKEAKKLALSLDTGTDRIIWELIKDLSLKPGKKSLHESEQILSQIEQNIKDEDQQS